MNSPHIAPLVEHPEIRVEEPTRSEWSHLKWHVSLVEECNGWRMRFVGSVLLNFLMLAIIVVQAVWIVRLLHP